MKLSPNPHMNYAGNPRRTRLKRLHEVTFARAVEVMAFRSARNAAPQPSCMLHVSFGEFYAWPCGVDLHHGTHRPERWESILFRRTSICCNSKYTCSRVKTVHSLRKTKVCLRLPTGCAQRTSLFAALGVHKYGACRQLYSARG